MDRQTINRIEQGHQAVIVDNLIQILTALDAAFADLD